MSQHEPPYDLLNRIDQATQDLIALERDMRQFDWPENTGFDMAGALLGAASRVYTAAAEMQDDSIPLPALEICATDAVVGAAALLRDQNLTPFELAVWFARVVGRASRSNSAYTPSGFAPKEDTQSSRVAAQ